MKEVVIVQRRLTNYRVSMFQRLREALQERDVHLRLLAGQGTHQEARKSDAGELSWREPLATRYFARGRLCWQPFASRVSGSDLVIVAQENKLISNHLLLAGPRSFRLAFWGHGRNFQSARPLGILERYKAWTCRQVDWWFGYTEMSLPPITNCGFPEDRITILNNSVDTQDMIAMRARVDGQRLLELRAQYGLRGYRVGVFVGSLYTEKRIDFLLEAASALRRRVPDFELLVVGDGELKDRVARFCHTNKWAHYVGAQTGQAKMDLLLLARVMLNPGAVGLGVLDSFVSGVPLVTLDDGLHGPEFAYLRSGENGIVTPAGLTNYVEAVCGVLTHDSLHAQLSAGCAASSKLYSLENMTERFAAGIERCLSMPRYAG